MKSKKIQYLETYEETLLKSQRYINAVCLKMGQDDHYEDTKQAGREGLWVAYTRFNPNDGREFHPFAIAYIKGYIMNYLTKNVRIIHIPANIQKKEDFYENKTISTDITINEETNSTIGDLIESDIIQHWDGIDLMEEPDYSQDLQRTLLMQYLSELKPNHQKIITMYYFDGKTIYEIADYLGITHQGVSQQLKLAIQKLQNKFKVEVTKIVNKKRNKKGAK